MKQYRNKFIALVVAMIMVLSLSPQAFSKNNVIVCNDGSTVTVDESLSAVYAVYDFYKHDTNIGAIPSPVLFFTLSNCNAFARLGDDGETIEVKLETTHSGGRLCRIISFAYTNGDGDGIAGLPLVKAHIDFIMPSGNVISKYTDSTGFAEIREGDFNMDDELMPTPTP